MNTKKEQTKNNLDQVRIAIATLKESQQQVNVKAISDLTGIGVPTLYNYEMVRAFVKPTERHKKVISKKSVVKPAQTTQDLVPHEVDSYANYINEHYFHHTEEVEDALQDMMVNVRNFRASVFQQAINKLKAAGAILELPNKPGLFNRGIPDARPRAQSKAEVKKEQPAPAEKVVAAANQPQYIIFNEATLTYDTASGEIELSKKVNSLLAGTIFELRIFKEVSRAKMAPKIESV